MESKRSNFWIGLGVGSILGTIVYRCCQTSKAKKLKNKLAHALHVATGQAENLVNAAKVKVANAGTKVADKVADETFEVAEKADEIKSKVHDLAGNVKK